MNYGKAFKELREEKGLSRAEVAKQIGCTKSALSKIENCRVLPRDKTIANFCAILLVPLARFYTLCFGPDDFRP